MKVLIVEDNLNDTNLLRFYLERQGWENIFAACNGAEGLEMARALKPDLIISDALMPQMDGFQLLRAVKSDETLKSTPFIFYSAVYIGNKEEELALSLGAEAFIVKPKDPDEFWECISAALERRSGRGVSPAVEKLLEEDEEFLKRYDQIVTAKLEEKVRELEDALARLRETETALRTANDELETRVAQRTEELEAKREELAAQNAELAGTCQRLETETAERVRAMDELRTKDQMLIQQSRMAATGEMLSNIAHHWRQPLNLVALTLQDLLMTRDIGRTALEGSLVKALQTIFQLSKTIDDFRLISVPDDSVQLFRVGPLIDKMVSLVEEGFHEQGIAIGVESEGDPQAEAAPNEFGQVILNLLINAKDAFTQRGIREGRVTIGSRSVGTHTVVTVTDNAGGIPEEILERIFDVYFSTKPAGHGTGLGLFMSRIIIEKNMKGRLTARNVDGGAEFRIVI